MKKLFENQNIGIYQIQKDLKLDIKTLYRYADGSCKIDNMSSKLLIKLADYFNVDARQLYKEMKDYEANNRL
jgi:hypothetical protein